MSGLSELIAKSCDEKIKASGAIRELESYREDLKKSLKEQEQNFKNIYENSLDAIAIVSIENLGVINCNKQFLNLFEFDFHKKAEGVDVLSLSPENQTDGVPSKQSIDLKIDIVSKEDANE